MSLGNGMYFHAGGIVAGGVAPAFFGKPFGFDTSVPITRNGIGDLTLTLTHALAETQGIIVCTDHFAGGGGGVPNTNFAISRPTPNTIRVISAAGGGAADVDCDILVLGMFPG
jgi:hypothetical protein